jgi:DNA mismatch repair protein MutS
VGAAGAALRYLKETQKSGAEHVSKVAVLTRGSQLVIDEVSRANLELLRTMKDGSRAGALVGVLDCSATPLGARRIARWLLAPLAQVDAISARHDAVQALVEKPTFREGLLTLLKQVGDVERLCGRLSLSSGGPRDLKALGRSLLVFPDLARTISTATAPLLAGLSSPLTHEALVTLCRVLERALVEEPPNVVGEGGFIAKGFHAGLDEYASLASSGKDYLQKLETRERDSTGIGSLKVRYNRVFGYYLEVTKSNLHLVPKSWIRKQTTVGAERYVTEELKTYEEKVLTADEKRIELELELFEELRRQVVSCAGPLKAAADAIATLDAVVAFARVAAENEYVRPEVDESSVIEIVQGRHPVVEQALKDDTFVPNDVLLDRNDRQVLIITGPNMAGKSTVMRQVALTVVMAQAGSFVPARRARIGLCDRVFTRVGASDNLAKGHSTFMVEMTETANILHHATKRSLVVLDEIGRGTSTFDGLSIAWAVAEHLHDRIGARTLFATHYHELTDLGREKARVKNCSIAVREDKGRVIFLRKLIDGAASRSYGIEVARLAGLPPEVLARARELLSNLEAGEFDDHGRPKLARRATAAKERDAAPKTSDTNQMALFAAAPKAAPSGSSQIVLDALSAFSIDSSTPLDALAAIARWKQLLT